MMQGFGWSFHCNSIEACGWEALYIGCVYMPTDSTSVTVIDSVYEQLKDDVISFKGRVVPFM